MFPMLWPISWMNTISPHRVTQPVVTEYIKPDCGVSLTSGSELLLQPIQAIPSLEKASPPRSNATRSAPNVVRSVSMLPNTAELNAVNEQLAFDAVQLGVIAASATSLSTAGASA